MKGGRVTGLFMGSERERGRGEEGESGRGGERGRKEGGEEIGERVP